MSNKIYLCFCQQKWFWTLEEHFWRKAVFGALVVDIYLPVIFQEYDQILKIDPSTLSSPVEIVAVITHPGETHKRPGIIHASTRLKSWAQGLKLNGQNFNKYKCQSSPLCSAHDDADLDLDDWFLALMRLGRRMMLLEESGMLSQGLRLSVFGRPCLDHWHGVFGVWDISRDCT